MNSRTNSCIANIQKTLKNIAVRRSSSRRKSLYFYCTKL